jgi:hypothetical protein
MARHHHNIEPSAFKRGAYVGYGGGTTWRITKGGLSGDWVAVPVAGHMDRITLRAPLLREMPVALEQLPRLPA